MKMPDNISEMQKSDPFLVSLFQKAKEKEPGAEPDFNRDILCKMAYSIFNRVSVAASGSPCTILTLGHSVPWAGHLG